MLSVFNRFNMSNNIKLAIAMTLGKVSKGTRLALEKANLIVRLRCKCGAKETLRNHNGRYICTRCAEKLSKEDQCLLTLPRRDRRKLGLCWRLS